MHICRRREKYFNRRDTKSGFKEYQKDFMTDFMDKKIPTFVV
jgi:hypothetical protein